jgi:hypothetical protein
MVYKLKGFKDFNLTLGMLSTTVKGVDFGQICPKFAQTQKFEIPPKIEILVFFKDKNFYV